VLSHVDTLTNLKSLRDFQRPILALAESRFGIVVEDVREN
jgi:hypothetical protein